MLTGNRSTSTQRITSVPRATHASRVVVHHSAISVESASTGTWISALISDAGSVVGAVFVQNTLWPTASVGIPIVLVHASASSSTIPFTTESICSTRRRWTRCDWFLFNSLCWSTKMHSSTATFTVKRQNQGHASRSNMQQLTKPEGFLKTCRKWCRTIRNIISNLSRW